MGHITRRRLLLVLLTGSAAVMALCAYAAWSQPDLSRSSSGHGEKSIRTPSAPAWSSSLTAWGADLPHDDFYFGSWFERGPLIGRFAAQLTFGSTRHPRIARLLAGLLRRNADPDDEVYGYEVTENQLVLIDPKGHRTVYTRAPASHLLYNSTSGN